MEYMAVAKGEKWEDPMCRNPHLRSSFFSLFSIVLVLVILHSYNKAYLPSAWRITCLSHESLQYYSFYTVYHPYPKKATENIKDAQSNMLSFIPKNICISLMCYLKMDPHLAWMLCLSRQIPLVILTKYLQNKFRNTMVCLLSA